MPEGIDPVEWEGVWVHEESFGIDAMVAVVKLASRDEARLDITWLELDGDEPKLSRWTGLLRESDDDLFLNVFSNGDDAGQSKRYSWARIERDGDIACAWVPAFDEFKKLVAEGTLPGQVDSVAYEVTLTELDADDLRSLSSKSAPTVPVFFRRIGR
jgi:hypothetical protein